MKVFRSILSLAFAFLVLVSSTSFMVGIHRCGGEMRSIALFTEAEPCPMEQQTPPCHRAILSGCCQDVSVVHEQQDFKGEVASFDISPSLIGEATVETVVLAEVIPFLAADVMQPPYDPPLRATDRVVALQVFLI